MSNPLVSLRYIHWLAPCMGDSDTRFYLRCIRIEPLKDGGCVLVATDGNVLLAVHDVDARADKAICFEPARALLRGASAASAGDMVELQSPWGQPQDFSGQPWAHEGWVDWRKVIPADTVPGLWIADARKVMAFRNVPETLIIRASAEKAPALVRSTEAPEALGVIMPYKVDNALFDIPRWAGRDAAGPGNEQVPPSPRRINADINAILARPKLTPMERYELLQKYEWSLKDKMQRHCMLELLLMRCAGLALGETPQVPDVPAAVDRVA